MKVFYHLLYEFQKGLRDLCLFTCNVEFQEKIIKSLNFQKIHYLIFQVGENKINVFFGTIECLEIINKFSSNNLDKLTPEEDFILGIMLGYARSQQYQRFIKRKALCA